MTRSTLIGSALLLLMGMSHGCADEQSMVRPTFMPLSEEPASVTDAFGRGAAAGGSPAVVSVTDVRRASNYRIGSGDRVAVFPDAIEARLEYRAGERLGEEILFRGPLSSGACGYLEDNPGMTVCGQFNFLPDGIAAGELWGFLVAPQGGPELGSVTTLAGRRLPPDTDPQVALDDLVAFLSER